MKSNARFVGFRCTLEKISGVQRQDMYKGILVIECGDYSVGDKEHQVTDSLEIVGLSIIGRFPCQDDRENQSANLKGVEVQGEIDAIGICQAHQYRYSQHDGDC